MDGEGSFNWTERGVKYEGQFVKNQLNGEGKLSWNEQNNEDNEEPEEEEPTPEDDVNGEEKKKKGEVVVKSYYEGSFLNGARDGFGVQLTSNHQLYKGEWKQVIHKNMMRIYGLFS